MEERFKTFTILISNISRSIRKIKTEEMKEFNLKSPHVSCLYYVYKEGALTFKELCDICEEDKGAISRTIDYLETNGYLLCDSNLNKKYKCPITLTENGNLVAKEIAKKIDSVLNKASEGLKEEERIILYKSLSLINNNLQKICDEKGE